MSWLGIDIGGANLKAADGHDWARVVPFPLWRDPAGLVGAIRQLFESAPAAARIAVTMTGELCDCFRSKAEGVRHILTAVCEAAAEREVWVYLVDGRLVPAELAETRPELAAASNWHALASFACRFVNEEAALLIDAGSTTTDIVPLVAGRPQPRGLDDTSRLLAGELIYSGIGRTPVCALLQHLPWRGATCPVAAELFATTADAYVVLGDLPEERSAEWTADGRPLTKEFARERLARMICADPVSFSRDDAQAAAAAVRRAQVEKLREGIMRVCSDTNPPPCWLVLSGRGEFLAKAAVSDVHPAVAIVSLSEELPGKASDAAPAYAVAVLARERGATG